MFSTGTDLSSIPTVSPSDAPEVQDLNDDITEIEEQINELKEEKREVEREANRKWEQVKNTRGGDDSDLLHRLRREASDLEEEASELAGHIQDYEKKLGALQEKRRETLQEVGTATEEEVAAFLEDGIRRLDELLTQTNEEAIPLFERLRTLKRKVRKHNRRAQKREGGEPIDVEIPPLPMIAKWDRTLRKWMQQMEDRGYR